MGKKKKNSQRKQRRRQRKHNSETENSLAASGFGWLDEGGVHAVFPGKQPPPEFLELLTENFQQRLRNSPLWDEMVSKFGEQEAEKLLKQCRAKFGA